MHSDLIFFKMSYNTFNSGAKLFQAAINTTTLQACLLLNVSSPVQGLKLRLTIGHYLVKR